MFHFSTDRLAGLDSMILKITAPPKVPTLIPNHSSPHDTYRIPFKKLTKQKPQPHRETRPPLADKTSFNNHPPRPRRATNSMLLRSLSTPGEANLFPPEDACSACLSVSPGVPSFHPLPPLPSASTLELPSFLNFSILSFGSHVDPLPRRSTASLPAPVLLPVSPSTVAPSRPVAPRKTRNKRVFEGPQWIPAFHHPNSPYVPWSSPVRQRILSPPSALSPSPVCASSPHIRSGAVAPEPWASSTFSHTRNRSAKERLSISWNKFKDSIKKQVKTIVSCVGKSRGALRTICITQDMLCTYDDTDTTTVCQPNLACDPMRPTLATGHHSSPSESLVSSDSTTLVAWLAERRATAIRMADDTAGEMSVEEYELAGSWLDLRHCDEGWVCGVQDCDIHTASGSPYVASSYPNGLRMAMPFDSADLLSAAHPSLAVAFPAGPFSASPRFHSLPRLPCQCFDIHSAQEAKLATLKNAERCVTRGRELSMPGGWTFN